MPNPHSCPINNRFWPIVVAQLVERLLLTPEVWGSNPGISKFYVNSQLYCKDQNKKRGRERTNFLNKWKMLDQRLAMLRTRIVRIEWKAEDHCTSIYFPKMSTFNFSLSVLLLFRRLLEDFVKIWRQRIEWIEPSFFDL